MMKQYSDVIRDLKSLRNTEKAKVLSRFFKTAKGEYGEGDKFLGIMVPQQRLLARKYRDIAFEDIDNLLKNEFHEIRLTALLILVYKSENATDRELLDLYDFYLSHTKHINNWDLVDVTCPRIIGRYLLDKDKAILYRLVKSDSLWERRIAVLATFWFIRNGRFKDALAMAEILLSDKHDLIHKAVGWMLREIGKRDERVLLEFLDAHFRDMPRTMLRYAIERLPASKKQYYLD